MVRSILYNYSDAYTLVKGTITVGNIYWLQKWNNKEIDYAKEIDVVMPMYNLIEYSDNCSKTSECWTIYKK